MSSSFTSLDLSKKISFYEYLFYSVDDFTTREHIVKELHKIPSLLTRITTIKLIKEMLSDDRTDNYRKYSLLSQFGASVVDECQLHFFFVTNEQDDEYKLKSAQYIFENINEIGNDMNEVEEYLISKLPLTKKFLDNMNGKTRIYGHEEEKKYKDKKTKLYRDKQNIHNSLINEPARKIIQELYSSFPSNIKDPQVVLKITNIFMKHIYSKNTELSIKRIITDVTTIENLKLIELFSLVLNEIYGLVELKSLTYEDAVDIIKTGLIEMSEKCFMGHAIRIVNMLSGISEKYTIQISLEEDFKNRLFSLCTRLFSEQNGEIYGKELKTKIEKSTIIEDLKKEFLCFDKWFEKYVNMFCGL